MYKVIVHKRALKYLSKITSTQKLKVKKHLTGLINNPLQHKDVKQMFGEWRGYYRMKVGAIRVVFWLDQAAKVIYIDHIGPRGDIYK